MTYSFCKPTVTSLIQRVENALDSWVGPTEAVGCSQKRLSPADFRTTMNAFAAVTKSNQRSATKTFYDLRVGGRFISDWAAITVLFGAPPTPEMYEGMTFRVHAILLRTGLVRVRVFESVIGLSRERAAIHSIYEKHLGRILELLDNVN